MITLRNVSKSFLQGRQVVRALDAVDLEVGTGEYVSVMGPSGSGKSTLLHLIAGLDKPTRGEILIQERDISEMSDDEITLFRRRKIGLIFQFFNLLPTLSAEENVAMPLLLDGARMRDARARAEEVLDLVGLAQRAAYKPDELSGGEMQRVAIARALVIDPLVLLADEPTGNLDSKTGGDILELLRGTTHGCRSVIMVTHDARAAAYGDRTIRMHDGHIVHDSGWVDAEDTELAIAF
jgi:putative ABC transport system ATP-binding protein